MKKDLILVIDGNSVAYRAFYALPMLANKNGEITNAIYGFLNMMLKGIDELNPTHIAVVFDYPAKLARHQIYADYKGTRKPMPPELAAQLPVLKNLLKLMGISVLEQKGDEADDIIGTISKRFKTDTVIITGDRDCLQLIDKSTKVMFTKKGLSSAQIYDENTFTNEYGFPPINIVDLKAIMGDSSDNIPGVAGIGEKGAKALINEYLTLENVYANLDNLKSRQKELLIASKDVAFMSKTLATINTNVDIKFELNDFILKLPFSEEAINEINRLQFISLLKKESFFNDSKSLQNVATFRKVEIKDLNKLEILLKDQRKFLSFIISDSRIELAFDLNVNYTIKINNNLLDDGINFKDALQVLKPILEDANVKKICFNFKATYYFLKQFNILINSKNSKRFSECNYDSETDYLNEIINLTCEPITDLDDTLISSWLLDANAKTEKIDDFFIYENTDNCAASILLIDEKNKSEMKKLELTALYLNVELPLVYVLIDMEEAGFKIDEKVLDDLISLYSKEIEKLTTDIYKLAGEEFNINSPKQLSEILFNKLNLQKYKKESTAIDTLNYLKDSHPIVQKIIDYRGASKLYNTYLIAFKEILKNTNGYIHTTFNPVGTTTGRLSSVNPNLQNLPVRTEKGKELRKLFISRFIDGKIISADYNQIELRLVANFSKDEKMVSSYLAGKDIHTTTASQIFGKPENEISKEERRQAKAVNFGIIYGISPFGLSEQIGIFPAQASAYIDKYFANFSSVKKFLDDSVEKAKAENGYVTTLFGRKRRVNELFNSNANLRHFGERAAKNMPLQGSASDIIKVAMIRVENRLHQEKLRSKLILQIHDELIIDSPKEEVEIASKILKEEMERVVNLLVPITADVEIGNSLFDV